MPDKLFLDSNVAIYGVSDNEAKRQKAIDLFLKEPVISTQVLSETISVLHRKWKLSYPVIADILEKSFPYATVIPVLPETIRIALMLGEKYGFSYYDCQIIASALEANCTTLCTEDMQHGQVIEDFLTIVNPFEVT
ncbi:MAG: PIN domain-containing protein [Magnetococcus sp. DMHC-1]|nr:PIN domain-containing protein [Magnetococcales bacterium]